MGGLGGMDMASMMGGMGGMRGRESKGRRWHVSPWLVLHGCTGTTACIRSGGAALAAVIGAAWVGMGVASRWQLYSQLSLSSESFRSQDDRGNACMPDRRFAWPLARVPDALPLKKK